MTTATTPVLPVPAVRVGRVPWQVKFLLLAGIWGSSFLLMMLGLRSLAPVQIAGLRILAGASTLVLLLRLTRGSLPRGRAVWGHLMVTGFFLGTLPFSLFAASEERVSSALAGIGNATTPLATVLFSLLLLPAERLPGRKLAAVLAGFVGVLVILQPWEALGRPDPVGFAMTLVAGASYGLGWTYVRRNLTKADLGGLAMPTAQLLASSAQVVLVLLGWWLLHRDSVATPWSLRPDATSGSALWPVVAVLALGVVGTGLAYVLQFDVVRAAGATVGTTVTYLIPVVAVVLGVVLLRERLAWPQVLGAGVVLASAVVIGLPGRRRARAVGPSERNRPAERTESAEPEAAAG
jgi:drug/metabolite transporter (DMT)-like permease